MFLASPQQTGPKKSIVSPKSIQLLENKVNPVSIIHTHQKRYFLYHCISRILLEEAKIMRDSIL